MSDLDKYPPGALRSYCELMASFNCSLADCLSEINEELGRRDRLNRLYEMLSGSRPTPREVRQFCARTSVGMVLKNAGLRSEHLGDERLDYIADALS